MGKKFGYLSRIFHLSHSIEITSVEEPKNEDQEKKIEGVSFRSRTSFQTQSSIPKNGKIEPRESVDFESAISSAGFGKFNYFLLLVSIPATMSSGIVTGSVSIVMPAVGCHFGASNFEKGLLQVSTYIGMIITAFFWGFASDSFGRKKLLMYGFLLDGLVGIGASLSPSLWVMIVFKIIGGALNSGPFSIFMAYLSEIFLKEYRDFAVLSSGIFSAIGNVLQPVLGYLLMWYAPFEPWEVFENYTILPWRLFLFICAMPSLLSGIGSIFMLESPKFLLEKGRRDEALGVFRTMYSVNTGMPASSYPVHTLHDVRSASIIASSNLEPNLTFCQRVQQGMGRSLSLFRPPFVGRLSIFIIIQFGAMAAMNSFRLWLPQLFALAESARLSNSSSSGGSFCDAISASNDAPASQQCEMTSPAPYTNMIIVNSGFLVSQLLFIFCVKYFGKKLPIIISTIMPSFFVASILFVPTSYVVYVSAVFVSMLSVTFFAVLVALVDVFPTSVRATSVSMTQMFGRVGVLMVTLSLSYLLFNQCKAIIIAIAVVLFGIGLVAMTLQVTPIEAPPHSHLPKKQVQRQNR